MKYLFSVMFLVSGIINSSASTTETWATVPSGPTYDSSYLAGVSAIERSTSEMFKVAFNKAIPVAKKTEIFTSLAQSGDRFDKSAASAFIAAVTQDPTKRKNDTKDPPEMAMVEVLYSLSEKNPWKKLEHFKFACELLTEVGYFGLQYNHLVHAKALIGYARASKELDMLNNASAVLEDLTAILNRDQSLSMDDANIILTAIKFHQEEIRGLE